MRKLTIKDFMQPDKSDEVIIEALEQIIALAGSTLALIKLKAELAKDKEQKEDGKITAPGGAMIQ